MLLTLTSQQVGYHICATHNVLKPGFLKFILLQRSNPGPPDHESVETTEVAVGTYLASYKEFSRKFLLVLKKSILKMSVSLYLSTILTFYLLRYRRVL